MTTPNDSAPAALDAALDRIEGLDAGIAGAVDALRQYGVETFESCEGGPGHAYPEPTVRFHGGHYEGFRAFAVAQMLALPVFTLRRVWVVNDGEPTGPYWELVFIRHVLRAEAPDDHA